MKASIEQLINFVMRQDDAKNLMECIEEVGVDRVLHEISLQLDPCLVVNADTYTHVIGEPETPERAIELYFCDGSFDRTYDSLYM